MPMGGEPGRRRLSGWAKPTLAAAVAILVGGGVWLAVPDTSPGPSGFAASLRLPFESPGAQSPGVHSSVDRRTLHNTDPPAATCTSTSLAGASGAWLADWLDDAGRPSLIPSQARRLGVLDFYWARLGTDPGSLSLQHDAPGAQSLRGVLAAAAAANPCGLRFITVSDDLTTKSVMATILADPQARQRMARPDRERGGQPDIRAVHGVRAGARGRVAPGAS